MSALDLEIVAHYPVMNGRRFLTLRRPSWNYHIVDVKRTRIKTFALPPDNLMYWMDWDFDVNVDQSESTQLVVNRPRIADTPQ